jgi:L-serine deaminase
MESINDVSLERPSDLTVGDVPDGVDRRAFLMRSAVAGAVAVIAGYVQLPCIERCAFGAVKSWTGFMIASNEIPANRRVDFDTTVNAMALTAREMNAKYKETSEGGLAVSLVLC